MSTHKRTRRLAALAALLAATLIATAGCLPEVIAVSKSGDLAVAKDKSILIATGLKAGKLVGGSIDLEAEASQVAWAPDGKSLVVALDNKSLAVIDTETGQVKEHLVTVEGEFEVHRPRFAPAGNQLAYLRAYEGGLEIHVRDMASGEDTMIAKGAGYYYAWTEAGTLLYLEFGDDPAARRAMDGDTLMAGRLVEAHPKNGVVRSAHVEAHPLCSLGPSAVEGEALLLSLPGPWPLSDEARAKKEKATYQVVRVTLVNGKAPAINKTQIQVVKGTKAVILSIAPTGQGFTTQIPDVDTQQVFGWTESGYEARGQAPYDTENSWIPGWIDAHTAVVLTDKGVLLFDTRTGTSKVVEAVEDEGTEDPGDDDGEDHGEAPTPKGEDPDAGPPK